MTLECPEVQRAVELAAQEGFALHFDDACRVCGAAIPERPIGVVREHEYRSTEVEFPVMQCPSCGLVYLWPRPDTSELSTIYPPDYYAYHLSKTDADQVGREPSAVERILESRARNALETRLKDLGVRAPSDRPLRVLDVGCGTGRHLDMIRDIFDGKVETHGVDLGELAVDTTKRRGHHGYLGRFEDVDLPTDYFDYVFSLHVIEHVAEPDGFLRRCAEVVRTDGVVHIETPNTETVDFGWFGARHWGTYHPPRHWYMFNLKSFTKLSESCGMELFGHGYYTNAFFWAWTMHSLLSRWRGLADRLFPPVTIYYGGFYALGVLVTLSMLDTLILKTTGRAGSIWLGLRVKRA